MKWHELILTPTLNRDERKMKCLSLDFVWIYNRSYMQRIPLEQMLLANITELNRVYFQSDLLERAGFVNFK